MTIALLQLQKLLGLTKEEIEAHDANRLIERGVIPHTDIALYVPTTG